MRRSHSVVVLSAFALISLGLISCTKKESAPEAPATETAAQQAAAPEATPAQTPAADLKPSVELTIGSDGDSIAFDKTSLEAPAGAVVKLTFKNNSKTSNMPHNWVLVQAGTEAKVAEASMAAGEANNWVKVSPEVLAHTKLVQPGQTDSVIFTMPAKGDYPYICTFPGHAMIMKGVLHAK